MPPEVAAHHLHIRQIDEKRRAPRMPLVSEDEADFAAVITGAKPLPAARVRIPRP